VSKFSALSRFAKWLAPFFTILFFSPLLLQIALAQDAVYQRTFPVSVGEVNAAVQKIRDSSKGRLPTLEGFVQQADQPTEQFDKGYFECTFQVSPIVSGGTLVRATAKVTAWYSDPNAAHSGYRVLVSNGRLENDVLDRIAEVVTPRPGSGANSKIASPRFPGSTTSGNTRPSAQGSLILPGTDTNWHAHAGPPLYGSTSGPSVSPSSATNLESAKTMHAAEEKKSRELSNHIRNLEEIQRNQSHPSDLAAVKKNKTAVLAKPSESAQVLMEAEAQDEFQVLGVDGVWVHVQISGVSRGWIRRSQLEMPLGFSQADNTSPESSSTPNAIFRVAKEETTPFRGNWQPLNGKPVRIEWVEPTNSAISTSRKDKLAYAKSVFLRASKNLAQSRPSVEGIVVVFDSADGGQIAAPLSTVEALADHTLSEAAFWGQCSLDPQESFIDSVNP
jgi:hypothetical protein